MWEKQRLSMARYLFAVDGESPSSLTRAVCSDNMCSFLISVIGVEPYRREILRLYMSSYF